MRITQTEYEQWAARHAATFGFAAPTDAKMFEVWKGIFLERNYTAAELAAATNAIAGRVEPLPYRDRHLAEINRVIHESRTGARQARQRRLEAEADERGTCVDCGDTGWMEVPHPRFVRDGEWIEKHLGAIACHCHRGARIIEAYNRCDDRTKDRIKPPVSFVDYCNRNPNFRQHLADYKAALEAHQHAVAVTRGVDASAGPLRKPTVPSLTAGIGKE